MSTADVGPLAPALACRSVLYHKDKTWRDSVQRVDVFSWMLQNGISSLTSPLHLEENSCRTDGKPGPCALAAGQTGLRMGGIDYGSFEVVSARFSTAPGTMLCPCAATRRH